MDFMGGTALGHRKDMILIPARASILSATAAKFFVYRFFEYQARRLSLKLQYCTISTCIALLTIIVDRFLLDTSNQLHSSFLNSFTIDFGLLRTLNDFQICQTDLCKSGSRQACSRILHQRWGALVQLNHVQRQVK